MKHGIGELGDKYYELYKSSLVPQDIRLAC